MEFNVYKSNFHSIIIPKKKRSLWSTNLLKTFSNREMKTLKEYWNIIGLSLPLGFNIGLKVKELEV
jgi:hypothetical protein